MNKTVRELAELVQGEVEGNADTPITGVAGLQDAAPEHLSFLANSKYARQAADSKAGAIIVTSTQPRPNPDCSLIRVQNPDVAFATICSLFAPAPLRYADGIHPTAVIGEGVSMGSGVSIGAHAVVESGAIIGDGSRLMPQVYVGHEARIGARCLLYPGVVVRDRCLIGNDVILHPGAIIGADGFGFDITSENAQKIPQTGIVRIDDRVEIGANTTVDRARFGQTWIQEGVKIDNLVQIAHNVVVGRNTLIASQVGISGSTRIGQRVIVAGQVGAVGHISIGDGAILCAQAGVSKDVPSRAMVAGYHARPIREEQRTEVYMRKLPELFEDVKQLKKQSQPQE